MMGDPESPGGGVTGAVVLDCLQENLPTICLPGSIFILDNASTHTAKIVQDWLSEWAKENGVEVLEWPPYLPDLNPIENVWYILKAEIMRQYPELVAMPKNNTAMEALVRVAITVWEELGEEVLDKLVESMNRRLQAVINAGGWYTKY